MRAYGVIRLTRLVRSMGPAIAVGSLAGAALSHRMPGYYLRYGLAILIGVAAARMWYQVLT